MISVSVFAAFVAGLASFLSPCVLPIIPGFLAYLSGTSLTNPDRKKMFLNSVLFVLGFSLVFALLGVLLNTVLARIGYVTQLWLSRFAGIVIVLFGLYLLGLFKIGFLQRQKRFHVKKERFTYFTSFIFGAAFAIGWTPCVGPILGAVLALTVSAPGHAFLLLIVYALGLGLPFLLVGAFSDRAVVLIKKSGTFLKYFNIVVGLFLVALGILVFTQSLGLIARFDLAYFLFS